MKTKLVPTLITVTFLAASGMCRVNAQSATSSATPSAATVPEGKHKHGNFDPDKRLAHLNKRLDLTQQQQTQILPLLQQEAQTLKSLKENTGLSEEQRKAQFRASMKSTHKQIFALLTPDQQKKMHGMHHKRGGDSPAPGSAAATPTPAV